MGEVVVGNGESGFQVGFICLDLSKEIIKTSTDTEGFCQLLDETYILIAIVGTLLICVYPWRKTSKRKPGQIVLFGRKSCVHTRVEPDDLAA